MLLQEDTMLISFDKSYHLFILCIIVWNVALWVEKQEWRVQGRSHRFKETFARAASFLRLHKQTKSRWLKSIDYRWKQAIATPRIPPTLLIVGGGRNGGGILLTIFAPSILISFAFLQKDSTDFIEPSSYLLIEKFDVTINSKCTNSLYHSSWVPLLSLRGHPGFIVDRHNSLLEPLPIL